MWFIGVEVEQETSAPPPKRNPGSAPEKCHNNYHYNNYLQVSKMEFKKRCFWVTHVNWK